MVWVQGCSLGCPGCFNPHTHSKGGGRTIAIEVLAQRILARSDIEGVTFSGGEPFEQAAPLHALARLLRPAGLSILAFSGFTIEEIRSGSVAQKALLEACDVLVDGRYDPKRATPRLWRGSSNQRIHFLTPRHLDWLPRIERVERTIEFQIAPDGSVTITGFPEPRLSRSLTGKPPSS